MTKEEYIQVLRERNTRKPFKILLVELVREYLEHIDKISISELIKMMVDRNNVQKYSIRDAIYWLIINDKLDFNFLNKGTSKPTLEIWLIKKPKLKLVKRSKEEQNQEQEQEQEPTVLPVFLSPSVRKSAKEQIARLRCFLIADENNKKAKSSNMVISITESKQLTLTYQADSFQSMETFINLIMHKSWRDE